MSTNKDLFKEAIADAKAVREAALTNAKAALEEALTPKLHSMIAAKLQEMGNDDEVKEVDFMRAHDTSDEMQDMGFGNTEQGRPGHGDTKVNEEELEEDFDLSAILAELDAEDSVNEAKKEDEEKEKMEEAEKEEAGEEEEPNEDETSEEEPTEEPAEEMSAEGENSITDLTVDQLKDIIKDIISSELEAEEYETPADEEAEMGGEEMGLDMGTKEPEMEIAEDLDEVDLEELLAELDALDETKEEEDESMQYEAKMKKTKKEDEKDEMKEAIDTINTLRNELQEINLLNAKLLFVNKIFSAKNLTESQKVKVIASFDKATTPKQAKELYESIQSSTIGASKKSQIKESLGFASKAAGVAPKNSANSIVESNDVIARMQKLANIIK
jgi:hypothetical protein